MRRHFGSLKFIVCQSIHRIMSVWEPKVRFVKLGLEKETKGVFKSVIALARASVTVNQSCCLTVSNVDCHRDLLFILVKVFSYLR